ncbi:hypothetical protein ACWC1C_01345 [Streptomyces sp. NPDC001705]
MSAAQKALAALFMVDGKAMDEEAAMRLARYSLNEHAHELAEKIQADMEEIRAADWGKSSRSKRPYLQGMERAKKAIDPQKEGQC